MVEERPISAQSFRREEWERRVAGRATTRAEGSTSAQVEFFSLFIQSGTLNHRLMLTALRHVFPIPWVLPKQALTDINAEVCLDPSKLTAEMNH